LLVDGIAARRHRRLKGIALRLIRFIIIFVLLQLVVAGCASRGTITIDPSAVGRGDVIPIFVGTTRAFDAASASFTAERSESLSFARYDVSVPPDRELGEITYPSPQGQPDPTTDFITTDARLLADANAFTRDLGDELRTRPRGDRDATIFIHGFNNTFAEGLYRLAQLSHDLDLPGVAVHYAWPSRGAALGYVADRDSALFARDGLERLINQVEASGAENIILVAHSTGSALLMESLRQMTIRGDTRTLGRIGGVVLISPDIDVDVFRSQAHAIGKLPQPFLIFGSDRDKILNLSARLTGEPERLGNLSEISRLADLDVTYLDSGAISEGAGHFDLATSPALRGLLARIGDVDSALASDRRARSGLLPGIVLTVRNATEIVLAPVAAISRGRRP
jgi:esterase/lipase superfamily enzyme